MLLTFQLNKLPINEVYDVLDEITDDKEIKEEKNQRTIFTLMRELTYDPARMLLTVLTEKRIQLSNHFLMKRISDFLFYEDEQFVKVATWCLMFCCGSYGVQLIEKIINGNPPP